MNRYTGFFRFEGFNVLPRKRNKLNGQLEKRLFTLRARYPNGLIVYYKLGEYDIYDESGSVRLPKIEIDYHYRALLNDNKVVAIQRNKYYEYQN